MAQRSWLSRTLGVVRTCFFYVGIGSLSLVAFPLCTGTRLLFGHRWAKRLHEIILGYGSLMWMGSIGLWSGRLVETPAVELLRQEGWRRSFVVAPNHASFIDHCLVSYLPIPKKYLTKQSYFSLPVFGWSQWIVGDIGVDVASRESRALSLQACDAMLKSSSAPSSVVIYPEGTRSPDAPALRPFRDGAFRLALSSGSPVLPCVLVNTYRAMPHGMRAGYAEMLIITGQPLRVESEEDIPRVRELVRDWMAFILELYENAPDGDIEAVTAQIERCAGVPLPPYHAAVGTPAETGDLPMHLVDLEVFGAWRQALVTEAVSKVLEEVEPEPALVEAESEPASAEAEPESAMAEAEASVGATLSKTVVETGIETVAE